VNSKRTPRGGDLDKPGRVGARKHEWIATQLRRVYDEALQEEIPPDMLALLDQLDQEGRDQEAETEDPAPKPPGNGEAPA
jgi:hypothetical protein